MKTNTIYALLFSILVLGSSSCMEDEVTKPESHLCESLLPPCTMTVSDLVGRVEYYAVAGDSVYGITLHVPGTIDSEVTGLVAALPGEYSTKGMSVTFSGNYKATASNPSPRTGGQDFYDLMLSSIKKN